MALSSTDLKRVLAYSTVSQIGFMMLALGHGALAAAMFHLATHALFKALLFLGAGNVPPCGWGAFGRGHTPVGRPEVSDAGD